MTYTSKFPARVIRVSDIVTYKGRTTPMMVVSAEGSYWNASRDDGYWLVTAKPIVGTTPGVCADERDFSVLVPAPQKHPKA